MHKIFKSDNIRIRNFLVSDGKSRKKLGEMIFTDVEWIEEGQNRAQGRGLHVYFTFTFFYPVGSAETREGRLLPAFFTLMWEHNERSAYLPQNKNRSVAATEPMSISNDTLSFC